MIFFRSIMLSFLLIIATKSLWAVSTRSLVLATSTTSALSGLSTQEVRKLFLGVPLEKAGVRLVPVLNTTDPVTYQVFLQKVEFMSENVYENQTVSIVFRLGGKRPDNYDNLNSLISTIKNNPAAVTFLWDDQVRANQGLKTVTVLWQGALE